RYMKRDVLRDPGRRCPHLEPRPPCPFRRKLKDRFRGFSGRSQEPQGDGRQIEPFRILRLFYPKCKPATLYAAPRQGLNITDPKAGIAGEQEGTFYFRI